MTPAAVARPLLRPGPRLLLEQLAGSSRHRRAGLASSRLAAARPSPACLGCSLRARARLYSTGRPTGPYASSTAVAAPPQGAPEKSAAEQTAAPGSGPGGLSSPPGSTSPPPGGERDPESLSAASAQPSPEEPSSFSATGAAAAAAGPATSPLSERFSTFMDNLQSRVLVASQALNDLTGYSGIEAIKRQNARLEAEMAAAQRDLRAARIHYKSVNERRAATQREVTGLLARKDTWSPADLERFTTLYRLDHEVEAQVAEAAQRLTDAEADESRLGAALNAGILRRYHEEQVWSDRIRRQSTWGTWGLMGVNVLLFLGLQFVAEPWKRARLMRGIAAEEQAALEGVRRELEGVRAALLEKAGEGGQAGADGVSALAPLPAADGAARAGKEAAAAAAPWRDLVPDLVRDPGLWRPALEDLCSERRIDLRMRDASLIALQGAAAGAALMAGVAALAFRR